MAFRLSNGQVVLTPPPQAQKCSLSQGAGTSISASGMITNGKVYVGTETELDVYGLL